MAIQNINKIITKSPQQLEEKILKAIFKNNNSLLEIIDIINYKMFTIGDYSSIYIAMLELLRSNTNINNETVKMWLETNGINIDFEVINKLYNESFTALNIKDTALILKELYQRRFMLINMREIIEKQEASPACSSDILESINDLAMKSGEIVANNTKDTKCCKDVEHFMQNFEEKFENKKTEDSIKVSLNVINSQLGGLKRGNVWTICADSQVGKSMLALQLSVDAITIDPNIVVDYYSLEMTKEEQENRAIAYYAKVEPQYIENPRKYFVRFDKVTGRYRDYYKENSESDEVLEFKDKIKNAVNFIHNSNLYIDDTPDLNIDTLYARVKRNYIKRGKIDLIVIDHMNILANGNPSEMVGELDKAYNKLKQLAKKLNCVVVALMQFSNELKNDELRKPNIFNLRGSGAPRHYSDVIVGIWRPEVYREVMDKHPELKGYCDLTWQKVRGCKKPDVTELDYHGYYFTEKTIQDDKKENIKNIYLDDEGNVIGEK